MLGTYESDLTANQRLTIDLGLHPESRVSACDVCGDKKSNQGERALIQYGRFMAHEGCYHAHAHLASLHRPPLNYEEVRQTEADSSRRLIERMRKVLEEERARAFEGLKIFWRAE